MVRFISFNRSLLLEVYSVAGVHKKQIALFLIFVILVCVLAYLGIQKLRERALVDEVGKRLMAIAVTAVDDFDPADLNELHFARDMKKEAYQRVFKKLNEIRDKNPEITFAYFARPTEDPMLFEFIVDADSNWNLPTHTPYSINQKADESEKYENIWPGFVYYDYSHCFSGNLSKGKICFFVLDQWGKAVSGVAPIIEKGKVVAILGLDYQF